MVRHKRQTMALDPEPEGKWPDSSYQHRPHGYTDAILHNLSKSNIAGDEEQRLEKSEGPAFQMIGRRLETCDQEMVLQCISDSKKFVFWLIDNEMVKSDEGMMRGDEELYSTSERIQKRKES